jgi:uncharacterized delta-60 repeat protein
MLVVTITVNRVEAASGDLDAHFGNGGFVTTDLDYDDQALGIATQSDGRIVLGVHSQPSDAVGDSDSILMRYNTDGTVDTSFGIGGIVRTDFLGFGGNVRCVKVDAQNRILAAGYIYTSSPPSYSYTDFVIARYTPSGALDPSFGLHGKVIRDSGAADLMGEIAIQKDGKIVVAGSAGGDFAVFRLTSNGFQDMTFADGNIVLTDFKNHADYATASVLQSDGRLVVGGISQWDITIGASGRSEFALARYNLNGTPDTTFGDDGKVTTRLSSNRDYCAELLIQPAQLPFLDEQIIAIGTKSFVSEGSARGDFALVCYQSNGALNPSFGDGGIVLTDFSGGHDFAYSAVRQPDGKIVIAGGRYVPGQYAFTLARYRSNGTLDSGFGNGGKVITTIADGYWGSLALTLQGGIIAAGTANVPGGGSNLALAKYLP